MVPAGTITEQAVQTLAGLMDPGDAIIDGGNSNFKDDVRRARALAEKGVQYLDAGTSGGVWGLDRGYCLMVGGPKDAFDRLEPIFATLAPGTGTIPPSPGREGLDSRAGRGYLHAGPSGAGHFVKMVHNGIEYGMMQAFAEGFDILRNRASDKLAADERYDFNLADIAELWRRGSVVALLAAGPVGQRPRQGRPPRKVLRPRRGLRRRIERAGGGMSWPPISPANRRFIDDQVTTP